MQCTLCTVFSMYAFNHFELMRWLPLISRCVSVWTFLFCPVAVLHSISTQQQKQNEKKINYFGIEVFANERKTVLLFSLFNRVLLLLFFWINSDNNSSSSSSSGSNCCKQILLMRKSSACNLQSRNCLYRTFYFSPPKCNSFLYTAKNSIE